VQGGEGKEEAWDGTLEGEEEGGGEVEERHIDETVYGKEEDEKEVERSAVGHAALAGTIGQVGLAGSQAPDLDTVQKLFETFFIQTRLPPASRLPSQHERTSRCNAYGV
jgi:hypothetical protein